VEPTTLRVSTQAGQQTLPGDKPAVVGRGRASDVVIADPRVSRRHVVLEPRADGWLVRDASAYGLWHAGRRVTTLHVQDVEIRLRLGAADGPELVLHPEPPAGRKPADQAIDELATLVAPGGTPTARGAAPRAARAASAAATGAATGESPPPPSAALRWLRTLPTLIWLAAAAFALGALIALS
jgi:predicted component of type VI protein secretion system